MRRDRSTVPNVACPSEIAMSETRTASEALRDLIWMLQETLAMCERAETGGMKAPPLLVAQVDAESAKFRVLLDYAKAAERDHA